MQAAILSQLSCSLVPHSTRPFWHQKWEQQCQKQQNEVPKPSNSARRRLFQEEMDPEEEKSNQEFVQRLLAELAERYKQKWNFDFDQGQPMNSANHPFQYEAVSAKQVPGFYRISTIFGQNPPHKNVHHERDENHWSPAEENASKMNEGIGKFVEGKATDLDGQMMAESGIGPMKSPSRILAKSKRRTTENETPKRSKKVSGSNSSSSSMEWAMEEGTNGQIAGEQSKITDFLNVRKGLATRSCTKTKKESAGIVMNSPKCRRHSLCLPISMHNSSPIKKVSVDFHRAQRRSQRLFHARQMLFK